MKDDSNQLKEPQTDERRTNMKVNHIKKCNSHVKPQLKKPMKTDKNPKEEKTM